MSVDEAIEFLRHTNLFAQQREAANIVLADIDRLRARLDKFGTDNAIAQELFMTERRLEKCRRLLRMACHYSGDVRTNDGSVVAWVKAAKAAGGDDE